MAQKFFDLEYRLRTDITFANKVKDAFSNLGDAHRKIAKFPEARPQLQVAALALLKLCGHNPILLSKYLVPISFEGLPLSFKRYPMAYYITTLIPELDLTVMGSRQIAKCRPVSATEPVWGANGMPLYPKDLKVGTKVLSMDGKNRREGEVTAIHKVGVQPVYKITMRSGRSVRVSGNHGLMKFTGWVDASTLVAGDKLAEVRTGGFFGSRKMRHDRIILTAYMLGDGSCSRGAALCFTKGHTAPLDEFLKLAAPLQPEPIRVQEKQGTHALGVFVRAHSTLGSWLKEDGIIGKHSWDKRIPDWVYELTEQDTRLFISRLWATDGSVTMPSSSAQICYSSSSPEIADGVKSLLAKFGILSTITSGPGKVDGAPKRKFYRVRVKTRESWIRFKELFNDIPGKPTDCIVPADTENNNDDVLPKAVNDENISWCNVTKVERMPDEECWDIEVGTWHNYVLDGLVSHNSISIAYRYLALGHMLRGYNGFYIVPHPEHLETFARKFEDMYQAFRFKAVTAKHGEKANLYFKRFRKGSSFALFHVLEDDTKARGKTGDELVFDEYQSFDADFHNVIDEILSASRWRIMIKLGTSLHTDTPLNYSFERSSKGYWHIFCAKCGHENIPLREEGVLDMIRPHGPCCVKCSAPLDATKGMYVHRHPDLMTQLAPRIGIHVPQLFTPAVLDNPARWRAMYQKMVSGGSVDKFLQENVGLPTEQGLRELTERDLQEMCRENDGSNRKPALFYQKKALDRKYRFVVSGCDWGGSDHNRSTKNKVSTTVHAMAGVLPNGTFELLHFRRYENMDYAGIADDIVTNHNRLNGFALASDFGVGYYYNMKLRESLPARKHLILQYAGPRTKLICRPPASEMLNHYAVNKTETISQLFNALKKERRILCYEWEGASPFLVDFLQVYRNMRENENGVTTLTFASNPSKPNDALQAVNYLYLLGKVLLGEPMFEDPQLQRDVESALFGNAAVIDTYDDYPDGGAWSG